MGIGDDDDFDGSTVKARLEPTREYQISRRSNAVPFLTLRLSRKNSPSAGNCLDLTTDTLSPCVNAPRCLSLSNCPLFVVLDSCLDGNLRSQLPRPLVYCSPCCAQMRTEYPKLVTLPLRRALPCRWTLLFESAPASMRPLTGKKG